MPWLRRAYRCNVALPITVKYEQRAELHIGPLPPPELLARYDLVVQNGAERIFRKFEQQTEHRIALEKLVITSDDRRATWGLIAGTAVVLSFLGASVFLILTGHSLEGMIFGSVDIVGLITAYLYGTTTRRQERQEKAHRDETPER